MSSAAEAEAGALYLNAKEAVYIGQILTKIGHPQPKTSIQTNNLMAKGVINSKTQPKRTKAMDMRYHWLQDRKAQGQFRFYWRPGKTNLADYFTKHHPPANHVNIRSEFLTMVKELAEAQHQREERQTKSKPTTS
jgi:ABC-type sulfate transport system substrate-binding protein